MMDVKRRLDVEIETIKFEIVGGVSRAALAPLERVLSCCDHDTVVQAAHVVVAQYD